MTDLDALSQALGPLVAAQVEASIQTAREEAAAPKAVTGTVIAILEDDSYVQVDMDDGGEPGSDLGSTIIAVRMADVAVDDRVRVAFYPRGGAEAHKVET